MAAMIPLLDLAQRQVCFTASYFHPDFIFLSVEGGFHW
jgi:hypothetical protein